MRRTQDSGAFLVVEGPSDSRLFSALTVPDCHRVPALSKENVLAVMGLLEADHVPGILGVVDADFDHVEKRMPGSRNIFPTDIHDLDAMIFRSPALDRVLAEFGSLKKIETLREVSGREPREVVLSSATDIGYARWAAIRQGVPLRFDGLTYQDFTDPLTCALDLPALIKSVMDNSMIHDLPEQEFIRNCQTLRESGHDPWQVCCGHDLLSLLSLFLRRGIGTNNASEVEPRVLQRSLRLAYRMAHFAPSNLHASIRGWESEHPGFMVFR